MNIVPIPLLSDNYGWALISEDERSCALVDPGEPQGVEAFLERQELEPRWVLLTHHHADHTGGLPDLIRNHPGIEVICSEPDRTRVAGVTHAAADQERSSILGLEATALLVPGHTRGSIAWWFQDDGALFTGDTLFGAGCGRLFEGTAEQMLGSLLRLRELPNETLVHCGHEYTVKNLRFAASLDPADANVGRRLRDAQEQRRRGQPTLPTTIELERLTNPFLRADQPAMMRATGKSDPLSTFVELRRRRDVF